MTRELPALVSLHDVMPQTFARMEEILVILAGKGIHRITLLVVPGLDWQEPQLARLGELADAGHELAAHGWSHQVDTVNGLYHRIHAALISRNVAEHLALDAAGITRLMQRAHDWFPEHGFPCPQLYVPPAWALGRISESLLKSLPYKQIELLESILCPATGKHVPAPMVGFEADSRWRRISVRAWNRWQLRKARRTGQPLRIGIHPHDFHLPLAGDLHRLLDRPLEPYRFCDW